MNSKFKKWLLRSLLACGVALVLLIGCLAWQSPGKTAPMIDESGKPKPGSVAQLEQVTLGGMPQWVLMRGEDNRKPVLLVLHGGPGTAEMLMMREYLFELEKHFVVVNWDQLGAGKSYSADIPPHLLSVDQFVASTIELATWLRQRFKQDKIYLMGHSWGSILGIKAIKKRPELFAAYIGVGQFVNFVEGERASYEYALRTSKERHIAEAVQELEAIGPPPYADDDDLKSTATERKWIVRFGGDTYGKTGYGFLRHPHSGHLMVPPPYIGQSFQPPDRDPVGSNGCQKDSTVLRLCPLLLEKLGSGREREYCSLPQSRLAGWPDHPYVGG